MYHIKVKSYKKTNKVMLASWSKPKKEDLENIDKLISKLKAEKKTFKFVENNVEKTFTFNGNNYVVTSKTVK